MAEQRQTRVIASKNGNRKPDKNERKIDPGIANDCKKMYVKKNANNTVKKWSSV